MEFQASTSLIQSSDDFSADAGITEVFIQAHIRLTQSNSEQILIGRLKSNKIKVTPAMLTK